jgi:hypothetical protein
MLVLYCFRKEKFMSVDYNACEFCGESIIDEYCYGRVIDGYEISVCKYCIEDEIKNGNITVIDDESAQYNMLSDEEKDDISNYGRIYKRTNNGIKEKIKEIDEQIENLLKEKADLLSK